MALFCLRVRHQHPERHHLHRRARLLCAGPRPAGAEILRASGAPRGKSGQRLSAAGRHRAGAGGLSAPCTATAFRPWWIYTSPVFWLFMTMVAVSIFIFRRREPGRERRLSRAAISLTPIIFIATCLYMLYSSRGLCRQWRMVGAAVSAGWNAASAAQQEARLKPAKRRVNRHSVRINANSKTKGVTMTSKFFLPLARLASCCRRDA